MSSLLEPLLISRAAAPLTSGPSPCSRELCRNLAPLLGAARSLTLWLCPRGCELPEGWTGPDSSPRSLHPAAAGPVLTVHATEPAGAHQKLEPRWLVGRTNCFLPDPEATAGALKLVRREGGGFDAAAGQRAHQGPPRFLPSDHDPLTEGSEGVSEGSTFLQSLEKDFKIKERVPLISL